MKRCSEHRKETIDKLRSGKTRTKKAAFMQNGSCLSGQPIANTSCRRFPGCQGNDGAGQVLLECTYADVKKQHTAQHDAAARMFAHESTKGTKGSYNLIADVGTVVKVKDTGLHSKRVPKFLSPHFHIHH